MRSRTLLLALAFVSAIVLPVIAYAAIPFFGPIIDGKILDQTCALGWGALITVINNIISLLITLAIVIVAPLMIAWSGFLFVVNPVKPEGRSEANKILTNTIVGIVLALAGYLIVAAIMAVLYHPSSTSGWQTWSDLVVGDSSNICIPLKGSLEQAAPTVAPPTIGVACSMPALSSLTDPLAQQMENGQTVIWSNTDPRLQTCVNKFIGKVGGSVTSAYRPQTYQTHLWEIRDRWCTQDLKSNSNSVCNSLKSTVSAEVSKHFGSAWSCGAVGATSRHTTGTAVDISGINQGSASVQQAASESCLQWQNYPDDPYHYDLKSSCSC